MWNSFHEPLALYLSSKHWKQRTRRTNRENSKGNAEKNRSRFCFLMFSVFSARPKEDFLLTLSRAHYLVGPFPYWIFTLSRAFAVLIHEWNNRRLTFWGQFSGFFPSTLLNAIFNFSVRPVARKNKEKFSRNENEIQNNGTLKSGARPNGEPRRRKSKSKPTMQ